MTDAASETADASTSDRTAGYVRFIILSGARTGSHMLAAALNSHPEIVCFREVYNHHLPAIQYGVEGYNESSEADKALRERDPVAFLHERIFCDHASDVRAVGFKWHYRHIWGLPIIDTLTADRELRVVHLRRRNDLRALASLRVAEQTGAWLDERPAGPAAALRRMLGTLKVGPRLAAPSQKRLRLSEQECRAFFKETAHNVQYFEEQFEGHPMATVYYEELLDDWQGALERVQSFLSVEARALRSDTRRQNPEPLRDLILNYDELRASFAGTPHEALFVDERAGT